MVDVNMDVHTGLRGILAVWVALFHCVLYSKLEYNLQGSSLMPFFFILSGFSLSVVYGSKSYIFNPIIPPEIAVWFPWKKTNVHVDSVKHQFDYTSFYRNRMARVMPLYYFCMLIAVPLYIVGFGSFNPYDVGAWVVSTITNLLPLNTLFSFLLGPPFDGPSWTVCTLVFFWLCFPRWIVFAQNFTDDQLIRNIVYCYYGQLSILLLIFFGTVSTIGFWPAFASATMNPLTRYPIFLMGVYAGVLCCRHPCGPLPWPTSTGLGFLPCYCGKKQSSGVTGGRNESVPKLSGSDDRGADDEANWTEPPSVSEYELHQQEGLLNVSAETDLWTNRVHKLTLVLLVHSVVLTVGEYVSGGSILTAVWSQAILPFLQLGLVVGLTRCDRSGSWVARLLLSSLSKWLGELSMAIYLIHWPLIYYLCLLLHGGPIEWPTDCSTEERRIYCVQFADARLIPVWGVPVVLVASVALAALLYYAVEVPARKAIQSLF